MTNSTSKQKKKHRRRRRKPKPKGGRPRVLNKDAVKKTWVVEPDDVAFLAEWQEQRGCTSEGEAVRQVFQWAREYWESRKRKLPAREPSSIPSDVVRRAKDIVREATRSAVQELGDYLGEQKVG